MFVGQAFSLTVPHNENSADNIPALQLSFTLHLPNLKSCEGFLRNCGIGEATFARLEITLPHQVDEIAITSHLLIFP